MARASGGFFRTKFVTDSEALISLAIRLADMLVVVAIGVLAYWYRHGDVALPDRYIFAIAFAAIGLANYGHLIGAYDRSELRRTRSQVGSISGGWVVVVVALLVVAYLIKYSDYFSRTWAALWFMITPVGLAMIRVLLSLQLTRMQRLGALKLNIVVYGAGEHGKALIRYLLREGSNDVAIAGLFDERRTRVPQEIDGVRLAGSTDNLIEFVRTHRVDEIVIALPWRARAHLRELMTRLKSVPADVKLCPEAIGFDLPNVGYSEVGGVPMLKVFERPITGWQKLLKATEDRILGVIFLLLLSPVLLLVALAVAVSSKGPVLFRQKRYGFNNNEFSVFKFRTMYHMPENAAADVPQATRNDPRVTPVGKFLRRTSLDELPQLFNVLRGEMSLVGPRPHAVQHNEQYALLIDDYLSRHRVKPGITGWAQINGLRGETQTREQMRRRVQHDIFYIENWSLGFDLKIIVLTLFVGFLNRNAY